MVVRDIDGAPLGMVERFEIDETGRLTGVVARLEAAIRKRIAAALIRELRFGALTVALRADDVASLPDVAPPANPFVADGASTRLSA